MAIDSPLQMEGKLSLVASFDDLMRCATVLNTGCEAGKQSTGLWCNLVCWLLHDFCYKKKSCIKLLTL